VINLIPFEPMHAKQIERQPEQSEEVDMTGCDGYSIVIDGKIYCCIGLIKVWKDRGRVWSLIDIKAGQHMVALIRTFKKLYKQHKIKRIEIDVKSDFKQGHRMAKLLGFKREGTMIKYFDDMNFDLYAKVEG
jgi:RimJ/RimL family protein N-acetyltransferase